MIATCQFAALRPLLMLCLATVMASAAVAASPEDKKIAKANQERIQRMLQAQQSLEQEKAQLGTEKADIERQLRSTRTELERTRASARREAAAQAELEAVRSDKGALAKRVSELEAQLTESNNKWRMATETDAQGRKLLLLTQQELEQRKTVLSRCENQNAGLYKLNTDLLARYEKAAGSGGLLSGGFFTQFERVRIENENASYQDQMEGLRVTSSAKPQ